MHRNGTANELINLFSTFTATQHCSQSNVTTHNFSPRVGFHSLIKNNWIEGCVHIEIIKKTLKFDKNNVREIFLIDKSVNR